MNELLARQFSYSREKEIELVYCFSLELWVLGYRTPITILYMCCWRGGFPDGHHSARRQGGLIIHPRGI
jgi:hypothetical protein